MMALVSEAFTSDDIFKALIQIVDKYRGRYSTIEEISGMTGVSVDQLQRVFNARSSSPIWANICIQKSRPVRLEKGDSTINYYCPYSESILVSNNSM